MESTNCLGDQLSLPARVREGGRSSVSPGKSGECGLEEFRSSSVTTRGVGLWRDVGERASEPDVKRVRMGEPHRSGNHGP